MKKKYYLLIAVLAFAVYAFATDQRLGGGADPQKTDSGRAEVSGRPMTVKYVSKEALAPAFGRASFGAAEVRADLSPRVKRFVRAHELYHLGDRALWGGWIGRETRANIVPGLADPAGLISTVFASLTPERLGFYRDRYRNGR